MIGRFRLLGAFWREDRSLSLVLALLVLNVFVTGPLGFAARLQEVSQMGFSFLILSGLAVVSRSRRVLAIGAALLAANVTVGWLGRWLVVPWLGVAELVLSGLLVAAMIGVVLARSLRGGPVTAHRISGAVAAYLLCGLFFAHAFAVVERLSPGSFTADTASLGAPGDWSGFLYCSMVTLATLGYGDITPLHPAARSLASLEAFIGQLYPAILIARLVALEMQDRQDGSR